MIVVAYDDRGNPIWKHEKDLVIKEAREKVEAEEVEVKEVKPKKKKK